MAMPNLLRTLGTISVWTLLVAGCAQQAEPPAPPAPEVTVQTAREGAVPLELTYAARTYGSREVDVRARVAGILLKRRFEEGSAVKAGQPLFQIDPEPVRARVNSARAEVAVAKARLDEARRQRDRVLPLFDQNAVSQSRRDEVVSAYEVAQANLLAAESQLRTAELDLEYTDVRAPIAGLTSREVLSEGSLVSLDQNSSLLTRIVQIDPLYVEFSVPEAEAGMIRSALHSQPEGRGPSVRLLLENGTEYPETARLTFIDNAVDRNSGTVRVRGVLANADAKLLPGQFIRARVEGIALDDVVAIPRKAVMSSAQGHFVWVVGADEKIEFRPVVIGRGMGNNVLVAQGLSEGERFVVEGVLKVQPGIQVSAISLDSSAQPAQVAPQQAGEEAA